MREHGDRNSLMVRGEGRIFHSDLLQPGGPLIGRLEAFPLSVPPAVLVEVGFEALRQLPLFALFRLIVQSAGRAGAAAAALPRAGPWGQCGGPGAAVLSKIRFGAAG
jgi:hypothetical protein